MKRVVFALTAIIALFVCGMTFAQDATDEPNIEYEQLKALKPMVGTYRGEWKDATGKQHESRFTVSWSVSKRLLTGDFEVRSAEAGEKINNQQWFSSLKQYYVWNHSAKCIECVQVESWRGKVDTSKVDVKGEGVYWYSGVRTTGTSANIAGMTVEVTNTEMSVNVTNRKNEDGESLNDQVFALKRVEEH